MYRIEYEKEAIDELKRLDKDIQKLIKQKLQILAENPQALRNNIKPLKHEYSGLYRFGRCFGS